jgi:hypothetical protein
MLNSRPLLEDSVLSNGAIADFTAVDFAGNQAGTQGMAVAGVAQFAASAAGQYVRVVMAGTSIMLTGGAFNRGDPIIVDNQGRAIKANALAIAAGATAVTSAAANGATDITGSDPTEHKIGRALSASAGAGNYAEILLGLNT